MVNTHSRAEQVALHGLLLLVVEVQNLIRNNAAVGADKTVAEIDDFVHSAHARELIQLARAALETRADNGNAHNQP